MTTNLLRELKPLFHSRMDIQGLRPGGRWISLSPLCPSATVLSSHFNSYNFLEHCDDLQVNSLDEEVGVLAALHRSKYKEGQVSTTRRTKPYDKVVRTKQYIPILRSPLKSIESPSRICMTKNWIPEADYLLIFSNVEDDVRFLSGPFSVSLVMFQLHHGFVVFRPPMHRRTLKSYYYLFLWLLSCLSPLSFY